MSFPASGYLSNAARTEGEMKTALEDQLKGIKQVPGAGVTQQALTISGGSITPASGASGIIAVDTEAAAATDDLTNIVQTNIDDNSLLVIRNANAARSVVVKHNTGGAGQISLAYGGNVTLSTTLQFLLLKREDTTWIELDRFPLPLTTKGDLLARTTTDLARVAVGANGKVLNADSTDANGVAWVSRSQPGWASFGNASKNNAPTPTTKYDLIVNDVAFWEPTSGNTYFKRTVATLTVDTAVAGPAANGRDQAGAFSASIWLYFYWIYNPGTDTVAGTVSMTGPATGPALPSGYTAWAYAGAVRYNGASNLVPTRMAGNWRHYETEQNALSGGTATTETAVSLTSLVPPTAGLFRLGGAMTVQSTEGAVYLRAVTGSNARTVYAFGASGETNQSGWGDVMLPNISQQFYYLWTSAITARSFNAWLYGYEEAISHGA